jgi:hypothetical protein
MMPVLTHFDHVYEGHTDSQSRRLAIMNRARREEMEAMLFATPSRHNVTRTGNSARKHEGVFRRMRAAIGNTLIAAGNRMQSPA